MSNRYVKDPHDVVSVGDVVRVWVKEIEKERRRVSLTMVAPGTERAKPERRERTDQKPQGGGGGDRGPRRRHDRGRRPPQHASSGQPVQQSVPVDGVAVTGAVEGQPATQTGQPPKKPYTGGGARTGGGKPPYKKHKPPPPPPKLTKAKQEGRVPLQTFAELAVFLKKKSEGEEKPTP
jgi:uncharacterized protein